MPVERRAVVAHEDFEAAERRRDGVEIARRCVAFGGHARLSWRRRSGARGTQRLHVVRRVVLPQHLVEAAGEGIVGELLAALDVGGRDHVLLVHFEQIADVLLRCGADAGHGLLGGGVDLAAQRVDLVGDVLLGGRLQANPPAPCRGRCAARYRWSAC